MRTKKDNENLPAPQKRAVRQTGGKEGKDAQTGFDYKTGATQALFLQHVLRSLKEGGRCGIVLDEGLLFRTNQEAFVKTKQKLLNDCDLWCIVSLPAGVFTAAGAGVKTNLLFFTKGQPTRTIWYYDLTDIKILKKTPLMLRHFDDFIRLLPSRATSGLSWTVDMDARKTAAAAEAQPFKDAALKKQREADELKERIKEMKKAGKSTSAAEAQLDRVVKEAREATARAQEIGDAVYDMKAVNPHKKPTADTRTPEQLLEVIEAKGREITAALAILKKKRA